MGATAGPLVAPDQLADLLWFSSAGQGGPDAVLVDLDVPIAADLLDRTRRAARTSARVLVGVAAGPVPATNLALARELTLSFAPLAPAPAFVAHPAPREAADRVCEVVSRWPLACASLAVLLQQTGRLPV